MKRIALVTFCAFAALFLASCGQNDDYKVFVGTWGVEKIEYYNIDYAGNPIPGSMEIFTYDPQDIDDGIQLIFRADKTGEMRDNNVDTIWNQAHDAYIVNPDTTLVRRFDYSYDKREAILYMNMDYVHTFKMYISSMTDNAFTYENEYEKDYVERAYLKRLSDTPSCKATSKHQKRPNMPGSLLGGR
jgi:hypothetical protein